MDISNGEMADLVGRVLSAEQLERSAIYWHKRVIPKDAPVRAGPQTFMMPFDGTLVFIDLAPGANWAHPCVYILVNINTLATQVIDSSFPPAFGPSDDDPVVVLQTGPEPLHNRHRRAADK
jgi:hypothetical protein